MTKQAELRKRYYVMLDRIAPKWTIQEVWRFNDGEIEGFCIPYASLEEYLVNMRNTLRKLDPGKHAELYWLVRDDIRGARAMIDDRNGYCVSWRIHGPE